MTRQFGVVFPFFQKAERLFDFQIKRNVIGSISFDMLFLTLKFRM